MTGVDNPKEARQDMRPLWAFGGAVPLPWCRALVRCLTTTGPGALQLELPPKGQGEREECGLLLGCQLR